MLLTVFRNHTPRPVGAVFLYSVIKLVPYILRIVSFLYVYVLYRILKIAKNADSIRNAIVCYGTFIYLLMHLLINLMGTLALIPLTGVPLPFLSYGGSFNMNVILILFVVERVAIENKQNAEKRELALLK